MPDSVLHPQVPLALLTPAHSEVHTPVGKQAGVGRKVAPAWPSCMFYQMGHILSITLCVYAEGGQC